jgi:DNA replication protein DnaC
METTAVWVEKLMMNLRKSTGPDLDAEYACDKCRDTGIVVLDEGNAAVCQCMKKKRRERLFASSKITSAFRNKTIENFCVLGRTSGVREMYENAKKYTENFAEIRHQEDNWIAFLGEPGCGKTHLSLAIANKLLDQEIPVLYFQHIEGVQEFLNLWDEHEIYHQRLEEMKKIPVLVWDDLFKPVGETNKTEKKIAFEVLNYRYLNLLPTIISSERSVKEICLLDRAIGSRIAERARKFAVTVTGLEHNYRLTKGA